MMRLSDFLKMEVVTQGGKSLGRVMEVRSAGEPEHGIVIKERQINELFCGGIGLLAFLGFQKSTVSSIDWRSIIAIKPQQIVVKDE